MGMFEREMSLFGAELQTLEQFQRLLRGPEFIRRAQVKVLPRLRCADGFSISVQASDFHRCEPKSLTGPYETAECASPSEATAELLPYLLHEDGIPPSDACYSFVPVALIISIINRHGGLAV